VKEAPGAFGAKWCMPATPAGGGGARLHIYNSLTRSKVPFVPIDKTGRHITMYVCGPTVYDAAHMGHARTYVQFDMVRRVLRTVAGYDVTYILNVTDVDDKIIKRSRERGVSAEALAREWEAAFLRDMAALNVERPTALPRVTEYIPEIVAFVERLVARGFAYCDGADGDDANNNKLGSVYFDTSAFVAAGFEYGKLMPEAVGSAALLAEGEGSLTDATAAEKLKKDPKDFAVWKASKPGEPSWPSPWGAGRPGWHIECSAMIEATIGRGRGIDIHGGGVDLKFPHHDNELAQSDAFCGCQSVNYFAHTGHLNIRGLKMSKSLKNFITIRQALDGIPGVTADDPDVPPVRPSTMRLMFALVKYNAPCDYSDNMLANARTVEKKFREFFLNVDAALRPVERNPLAIQKWTPKEEALAAAEKLAARDVRMRLLDDFDTPGAVLALQGLVDATNAYLDKTSTAGDPVVPLVVAAAADSVARVLDDVLGVPDLASADLKVALRRGRLSSSSSGEDASSADARTTSKQEVLAPVLDVIAAFRDDVRRAARAGDAKAVLALCDKLRDDALPDLGVRLEDKAGASVWKLDDPATLRAERDRKLADEADKRRKKDEADAKARAKLEAMRRDPRDLFTTGDRAVAYSRFDIDGLPTHDAAGEPLSKSQLKKNKKEWDKQAALYAEYLKTQQPSDPTDAPTPE